MTVIPNPDPQVWRMILEQHPEGPDLLEKGESPILGDLDENGTNAERKT